MPNEESTERKEGPELTRDSTVKVAPDVLFSEVQGEALWEPLRTSSSRRMAPPWINSGLTC